ncbi:MAG: PorP/SprF family type IX secretion system membrane protein [Paludibacteraceae bacterium]|nr:PorP/SprF family type IX secretion system membrane protein [Paludibacteraceae bacterium]
MMGIRKLLLNLCVAALPAAAWAQFDTQRTQYMFSTTAYNPAAIAQDDMCDVLGVYRMQWAGFSRAPKEWVVSAAAPLSIADTKHGLGASFMSESIGLFESSTFIVQYAFRFPLWNGNLGLGLNLGGISQNFASQDADFTGNNNSAVSGDTYHSDSSDPMVQGSENDDMAFTAGFGAYYSDERMHIGLSVLNLNNPTFDLGETESIETVRVFYLNGGYDFDLAEKEIKIKPSFLWGTDFSTSQVNLTCLGEYKKKYVAGLGYRFGDSLDFMVGANLLNGVYVGYAYDLPVSGMIKSGGSHELCLKYSFKLEFSKKNKYKSERIL